MKTLEERKYDELSILIFNFLRSSEAQEIINEGYKKLENKIAQCKKDFSKKEFVDKAWKRMIPNLRKTFELVTENFMRSGYFGATMILEEDFSKQAVNDLTSYAPKSAAITFFKADVELQIAKMYQAYEDIYSNDWAEIEKMI